MGHPRCKVTQGGETFISPNLILQPAQLPKVPQQEEMAQIAAIAVDNARRGDAHGHDAAAWGRKHVLALQHLVPPFQFGHEPSPVHAPETGQSPPLDLRDRLPDEGGRSRIGQHDSPFGIGGQEPQRQARHNL